MAKTKQPGPLIRAIGKRKHTKASEEYVDVVFEYPEHGEHWEGSVPIEYRRTGVSAKTDSEIEDVLRGAYDAMNPEKRTQWLRTQDAYWSESNKKVTRPFFDALKDSEWKCIGCQLPKNPNWARRVQDIKEMGYTIATHTKRPCPRCRKNTTQLIMLRIPRGEPTGYESWSPALRSRILGVLKNWDAYENRVGTALLPDHKFPEIRWGADTREENLDDMTDAQIRAKFQLLSNQRNEQKREVCRNCFQTGVRGAPFGTKFYYHGGDKWPENVPKTGKAAEKGCIGCGWYDLQQWRAELNKLHAER
jgi:hypothetical protein